MAECIGTFFFMVVACMVDLQWDSTIGVDVVRLGLTLDFAGKFMLSISKGYFFLFVE